MTLSGKVVVVTGGGAGIGAAVARLGAEQGAQVAVLDLEIGAADAALLAIRCDVGREGDVRAAFGEVRKRLGGLDGLVCCAGVDVGGLAHELSTQAWERVLRTNLLGVHLACREALRLLLAEARGGSIVCVSSPLAFVGVPGGTSAYSASKGGVSALVRTLAVDYAAHRVRVNALVPGPTDTALMWANVPAGDVDRLREVIGREVPLGRLAAPEEPARAALWLLSDEASYVTGSHLFCDGGVTAKASISV